MRRLDLVGHKFGRLTVIKLDDNSVGRTKWVCQCECGKEKVVLGTSLTTGNTKSCGCSTGRFIEEIPGTRYGKLVVVRRGATIYSRNGASRGPSWICQCDCGNSVAVSGHSLREGNTMSCGCLRLERALEKISKPAGVAARNRAVATMKANAVRRELPWRLTEAEIETLMGQPCHYCGSVPSNVVKSRNESVCYSGIDRLDSSKGYTTDNVVPCCHVCNNAKRTMSVDEFLGWISRVYSYSCSGNTRER